MFVQKIISFFLDVVTSFRYGFYLSEAFEETDYEIST